MAAMWGVRKIFLKVLAIVYFAAFWSWKDQVLGLVGENGILPATHFLNSLESFGVSKYWLFPNLFWMRLADSTLTMTCTIGLCFSITLLLGMATRFSLAMLWILYSSHVLIGQDFMSFQWEALLLEVGFLSIFLGHPTFAPSKITVWLFRLLLFRLMLMSGLVKLMSQDPLWSSLTALQFHFETQPLPSPLAWTFHHFSPAVLKAGCVFMFITELVIPFFFLMPRPFRLIAFWFHSTLQVLIFISGNYNFFNILALGLGLFLIDDKHLGLFVPKRLLKRPLPTIPWSIPLGVDAQFIVLQLRRIFKYGGAALIGLSGVLIILRLFSISLLPAPWNDQLLQYVRHYHVVNGYGLFAVMTHPRYELEIEGSLDKKNWKAYTFKYKPQDPYKLPGWVAPYQPRLDWQFWFASLSFDFNRHWLQNLNHRLIQGSPEVLKLFREDPFQGARPKWIRVRKYLYTFTTPMERAATGAIWNVKFEREILSPGAF